jgi:hypothetical protein
MYRSSYPHIRLLTAEQPPRSKYITKKTVTEFTNPERLPTHIEDEILEALANYSIEHDMDTSDLAQYFKDIKVPNIFIVGNKRLNPDGLVIEGTKIIDFDKLMIVSYHLILFRNNRDLIQQTWKLLLSEQKSKDLTSSINLTQLQDINENARIGISTPLLLDMIALATDGRSVTMSIVDFAYVLGKLNKLETE